jgi:L-aspartate oxidase
MTWLGADELDLLVLGSGVAGLSAAVRAADELGLRVGVLTKSELSQAATRWAQGGVAAVLSADPDSTDLHLADTLSAGVDLCDVEAVRTLVDEGPSRVNELIAMGAIFDRDHDGSLQLAREGGHSQPRIVHAGGAATGAEIERALVDRVRATAVACWERWFALDLLVKDGRCVGVVALADDGSVNEVRSHHVLLATGGAGQLFAATTNPLESTGDGLAMALRAGVACADVEFVQFHPTALQIPRMPRPLLSEALRGHGALIRDLDGDRFVDELQPRDVVARAITRKMLEVDADHMLLDATGLDHFDERFPTIAADLRSAGLDPAVDYLPIAPAAHYHCGGVVTDLNGASTLPGLWAAGEVACTGVHGANRLASNSLLEGMVYGPRVIEAIDRGVAHAGPTGAMRAVLEPGRERDGMIAGRLLRRPSYTVDGTTPTISVAGGVTVDGDVEGWRSRLQRSMTRGAGVLRDAFSLAETRDVLQSTLAAVDVLAKGAAREELRNLTTVGTALLTAAEARQESRGCHTRSDFPDTDAAFRVRLVF